MSAVLDVSKSNESKKNEEDVLDEEQEDVEDGSNVTKKRRKRRKKKAQTNSKYLNSVLCITFQHNFYAICIFQVMKRKQMKRLR